MQKNGKRIIAIAMAGILSAGMMPVGTTDASAAAKIKLSKSKLTLTVGKKATIKLKHVKKKNIKEIKWTTSNKKVAIVFPSKKSAKTTVKAVRAGKATIRAKLLGKKYSCKVTVKAKKAKKEEQNIGMLRDTYATYVGTAVGVRPLALGDEPVDMSRLTYKSSNPFVAKIVGNQGTVEGVKAGSATITITTDMGHKLTATVKVFASKEDADEANDFHQKTLNDRIAEMKAEGIYVDDGTEPVGVNRQQANLNKMVRDFSDPYLAYVKSGKKYPDNTPADVIASIRSVFDLDETAKKERLTEDLKAYLEPLEKAQTLEDVLAANEKFLQDGENGFWQTGFPCSYADGDYGDVKIEGSVPLITLNLVPALFMGRKSDFKDSQLVERLEKMIEESLRLTGESEADIEKNAPALVKVLEEITPAIRWEDVKQQVLAMSPEEQKKFVEENQLGYIAGYVSDIDTKVPGLHMNRIYKGAGVPNDAVIFTEEMINYWNGLIGFLENGSIDLVRELLKFCVTYRYLDYTENSYKARILFEYKKLGFISDPTEEVMKKNYRDKSIMFLCDKTGFEICGEYVEKYLGGTKVKEDLGKLVEHNIAGYKEAFQECPWLSEQGKTAALEKIDKMKYIIGDTGDCELFRLRKDLQTAEEGGSIFSNYHIVSQNDLSNFVSLTGKKLKGEDLFFFVMRNGGATPMECNSLYEKSSNTFAIGAGYIGTETYKEGDDIYNLGRMGYTVGHEIGHGFDSEGANYNFEGERKPWMTDEDIQRFNLIQLKYAKLFDQYSAYYDKATETIYYADGQKELRENMADLSAAEMIVRIGKKMNSPNAMKELLKNMSLFWTDMYFDPGFILSDTHGPSVLRSIVPLQMQDEFYEAFGIKQGDAMYIAPENRVRLWS